MLIERQNRSSPSKDDFDYEETLSILSVGPFCCGHDFPPVNSDRERKHKCQASANYVCRVGVNFPLDENPLSLGEMCIPVLFSGLPRFSKSGYYYPFHQILDNDFYVVRIQPFIKILSLCWIFYSMNTNIFVIFFWLPYRQCYIKEGIMSSGDMLKFCFYYSLACDLLQAS